jgi:hypothetical protein
MAIEGKVARILNARELVINRGSEAGVAPDMVFAVLQVEKDILDPDTKQTLGSLETVKIKVKVVEVQPKMSVCRTFETIQVNVGGKGIDIGGLGGLLTPPKWVTRVETLQYADSRAFEGLGEKGSYVSVGDKVRQVQSEGVSNGPAS